MKPLAFSYSKIKNYRTCPKRHYHCDITREFKDDSDALEFGSFFHEAMEKRIKKGTRLPLTLLRYESWGAELDTWKKDGPLKAELKLSFDKQFQPTEYFDASTWWRSRIDVAWFPKWAKDTAVLLDWKTGKPPKAADHDAQQSGLQQLALSAQTIFANHPEIEKVRTSYVWVGYDAKPSFEDFTRADMPGLWSGLLPEMKQMEEAYRTTSYPPTPSWLCKRFCPVTVCPHHGRDFG